MNDAVKAALRKVNIDETLIVVTDDHSHTLTIAGYARRGNPILGISIGVDGEPMVGTDGKPYTTIGFANGPSSVTGSASQGGHGRPSTESLAGIAPAGN
jgi:alkaline phosphatase